jgi:Cys-tRNA(Pro) deacylase
MTDEITPVTETLTSLDIPFRTFRHPGPVNSLEQAAQERGQEPEQVVRSLLFRLAKGYYIMVLIAGPAQVSWPALRQYVGQSRITMADQGEVLQVTGYKLGAVSPFGLPIPLRILLDDSALKPDEVSIGSGERGLTVILRSADLKKALGDVEIVQLQKV